MIERRVEIPADELEKFKTCLRRRFRKREIEEILKASDFAAAAHEGQLRQNGAPYVIHPIAVASLVSDWQLDKESVIAALLHDVVEDTDHTLDELKGLFGKAASEIVNGVSKIEQIEQGVDRHEHKAAESFRKMLLAISQDWRVILIKLADRLHNMRTLGNLKSRSKRRRIARETLDIYAPIAERLGFQPVRDELQSLSFEHIYPVRFSVLHSALARSQEQNRIAMPKIKRGISSALRKSGIKANLAARNKNVYSVYRKMIDKNLSFNEVDDIIGFRLVVPTRLDCYTALGVLHEKFRPVPEKLKDYIAQPKINGYQSLHTTVLANNGNIIEVQIRTKEMDRFAEYGVAAHWHYKVDEHAANKQGHTGKIQIDTNRQLESLFTMSKLGVEPGEFLRNLRLDLFPNDVFVLTPKGQVIQLPKGSTVLDMAYAVHTELGDKADRSTVNGQRMPISALLASGDIVRIVTDENVVPNPQWLSFVATSKARSHIRGKLKQSWTEELVGLGRELLDRSARRTGRNPEDIDDKTIENYLVNHPSIASKEELFSQIALSTYHADVIAKEILGPGAHKVEKDAEISISLAGDKRAGITRAECCEPLPPEEIIGVMKRNKGLVVHRKNCAAISKLIESDRYISMHWGDGSTNSSYRISLKLECTNRKGLLAQVMAQFSHEGVNIVSVNIDGAEESNPVAIIDAVVQVKDALQIERFIRRINRITGVTVSRAGSGPTVTSGRG